MLAVFIFHCDLRLIDNTSLLQAVNDGYKILPIFIFTPEQIDKNKNEYFSDSAVQFMCESIKEIPIIKLFKGNTLTILEKLYNDLHYDAIYFNESYSVYAVKRDESIRKFCTEKNIKCVSKEDYGLLPLMDGLVSENKPYTVFSPFYRKVLSMKIRNVDKTILPISSFTKIRFLDYEYKSSDMNLLYENNKNAKIRGGRELGVKILDCHLKTLKDYEEKRNYPALNQTSLASPHLKFGTISVREMYHKILKLFGKDHGLIRELIFREFYIKIYAIIPKVQRGVAVSHLNISWLNDSSLFEKWKNGTTGFPLVDAGMRELNNTGHQHNRVRMLCANILTKYFLIDWRLGMKYYYTKLVDADIFSNTAGWQWASSTGGASSIPYYRPPFNPFIQSNKYDKDCVYIKKWVPELKQVDSKDIHNWYKSEVRYKYPNTYIEPVIDYRFASKRAVDVYKKAHAEK